MKVARLHAPSDIRLHVEPDPLPADGEELLRITAVGLCGSDRHWFSEGSIGDAVLTTPLVLGHELPGVIETGPRRGQRVAIDPAVPCGTCELCAALTWRTCAPNLRFAGHGTTDGGLRTLMTWPAQLLAPIPDRIGDDEAALLEPLGVALHAADLGKVRPGMSAGVFGCGPIGLLLIQVLREIGAGRILATDPLAHRLAAASALGATDARPPVAGSSPHAGGQSPLGQVDVAFETGGRRRRTRDAISAVRPGGRVVLVGIPGSDRTSFIASAARRKGLTLAAHPAHAG